MNSNLIETNRIESDRAHIEPNRIKSQPMPSRARAKMMFFFPPYGLGCMVLLHKINISASPGLPWASPGLPWASPGRSRAEPSQPEQSQAAPCRARWSQGETGRAEPSLATTSRGKLTRARSEPVRFGILGSHISLFFPSVYFGLLVKV